MMLRGIFTALITPFDSYDVDYQGLENLISFQLQSAVDGIVILGSTGEASTLTGDERSQIVKFCINKIKKINANLPVIVGCSSNATEKALDYVSEAKQLAADAALIVCPYYNKPSQSGMYAHFKYLNDYADFPLIIYNVPSRTVVNIADETVAKLAQLSNIIAIKDATGDLTRPLNLAQLLTLQPKKIIQLSGDDATSVAFNLHGGEGCISVISNLLPQEFTTLQALTLEGKYTQAINILNKFLTLNNLLYCEANPIAVKYAAYCLNLIKSPEVRLPLIELTSNQQLLIKEQLEILGLL